MMTEIATQKDKFPNNRSSILLLDCCRFDLFKEINWLSGRLEKVKSLASETRKASRIMDSIIENRDIITTHPRNRVYNSIDPTTMKDYDVPFYDPAPVIDYYLNHKDQDKKFLLWFIQPHRPFIGEVKWLPEEYLDVNFSTESMGKRKKELGIDFIRKGQATNLEFILEKIEKNFEPPYVITSDHGDAWGENNKWDHGENWDFPAVRHVPWFVKEE